MAQAKKSKKKISKALGEILKAPKKVETVVKPVAVVEKYVNKAHWDTKEEFAAAIAKTGLTSDFVNLNNEWALYQSDKEGYRNVMKFEGK